MLLLAGRLSAQAWCSLYDGNGRYIGDVHCGDTETVANILHKNNLVTPQVVDADEVAVRTILAPKYVQTLVGEERPLQVRLIQTSLLPAQAAGVTVSFSGQGPEAMKAVTGQVLKGTQIVKASVCASAPGMINVGRVLSFANAQGIADLDPDITTALVQQTTD